MFLNNTVDYWLTEILLATVIIVSLAFIYVFWLPVTSYTTSSNTGNNAFPYYYLQPLQQVTKFLYLICPFHYQVLLPVMNIVLLLPRLVVLPTDILHFVLYIEIGNFVILQDRNVVAAPRAGQRRVSGIVENSGGLAIWR